MWRVWIAACSAALALIVTVASRAQEIPASARSAAERKVRIHIDSEPLSKALIELGRQTDMEIGAQSDTLDNVISPALLGTYRVAEALEKLIEVKRGELFYKFVDEKNVEIRRRVPETVISPSVSSASKSESRTDSAARLEQVIVTGTGTHFPGSDSEFSPIRVHDQDALADSGVATLAQFAAILTENVPSISPVASLFGNSAGGPQQTDNNPFLGSGFDLHGLGVGGTLTLLNGYRWAGGGVSGNVFDLSLVPLNAVDRIAVLGDGASAIYGSDAIAGVVNIVLRSGFDGSESSVRYSTMTDGGGTEWTASQSVGRTWDGGSFMAAYQFDDQEGVSSAQRNFIRRIEPALEIIPEQRRSGVIITAQQKFNEGTTMEVNLLYGARDFSDFNGGLSGYLLARSGRVEELGAVTHIDQRITDSWHAGLSVSYSQMDQSLTTIAPTVGLFQIEPGDSMLQEAALTANGKLLELPGGDLLVALGVGTRKESLVVATALYGANYGWLSRTIEDAYAEVRAPLVKRENSHILLRRLELDLALREDHYGDVGSTRNPKVGLLWSPYAMLSVRATYARSFCPPALNQLAVIPLFYTQALADRSGATGTVDTLINQSQGLSRLRPETAKTVTSGFDYQVGSAQGFTASLTYYRTQFEDRVATPPVVGSLGFGADIFEQPPLESYISRALDSQWVQSVFNGPGFVHDYAGGGPSAVTAVFNDQLTNIAETVQAGIEASAGYTRNSGYGAIHGFLTANYLLRDVYRAAPGAPTVSVLGDVGQPVNFRARLGLTWSPKLWRVGWYVNYMGDSHDSLAIPIQHVASFTTHELQVGYQLPVLTEPTRELKLTLDALNIFDRRPPSVAVPDVPPYRDIGIDATRVSPAGRTVSLQVSWKF